MNAIAELFANARATSQLKPRYYWATSLVGILAGIVGMALMYASAVVLAAVLGLDLDSPIRESNAGLIWAGLFLTAIPLSFLAAMVPVAWLCGSVLVRIGYMKREDVKYYALRSRYPAHWFKEGNTPPHGGRNAA